MSVPYLEIKQEIIAACHKLVEKEYFIGTYGNVSVRLDAGSMFVTPSKVDYAALQPEDIVTIALDDCRVLDGARFASSESQLHRHIYLRRPDVQAIVHTHSLYATTVSAMRVPIPVIVEEQSHLLGGEIACTRSYIPAGQHEAVGREAAEALGDCNAVLVVNHGVVCCGRSLVEAMFAAEVVERAARMWLLASSAGTPTVIPPEHVRSERERFLYKYGTAEDGAAKTA